MSDTASTPRSEPGGQFTTDVIVRGSGAAFAQEISAGSHRLTSDEPVAVGGTDAGPTPYELLMAALGS
jgi:putative redox protein